MKVKNKNRSYSLAADNEKEAIIRLARSNPWQSYQEIADEVGTTRGYVSNVLDRTNISLRKLREKEYIYIVKQNKKLKEQLNVFKKGEK